MSFTGNPDCKHFRFDPACQHCLDQKAVNAELRKILFCRETLKASQDDAFEQMRLEDLRRAKEDRFEEMLKTGRPAYGYESEDYSDLYPPNNE